MYKSPIKIITEQIKTNYDNAIYSAVQNVGINVDREELLKALEYDRGQYEKGFDDGFAQALEIALQDAEAGRRTGMKNCREFFICIFVVFIIGFTLGVMMCKL